MLLKKFFEAVCEDVAAAALAGAAHALEEARNADRLDVHVPIGGEKLKVEGAANLSPSVLLARQVRLKTQGYITEAETEGEESALEIELKRDLLKGASEVIVEIEFEQSQHLESLERIRDHAGDVNRHHLAVHRATLARSGVNVIMDDKKKGDKKLVSFQKDTQAAQYDFWARGDAAYVMWSSDQARTEWVDKVKGWKEYADGNDGVFEDGSTLTEENNDG